MTSFPGNSKPSPRSLLSDRRGSVTAEAVIMLPVFIILWACFMFVQQKYTRSITVQSAARRCAWAVAKNSCEETTMEGCEVAEGMDMANATYPGGDGGLISGAEQGVGFMGDFISDIIFGKDITARTHGTTPRANVLGGGETNHRGAMGLSCNEKAQGDLGDILGRLVGDVFGEFTPW